MTPFFSIIVPVYNAAKYLDRCIDSIIKQSFNDWECILIDDGSTDESGRICDQYSSKDSRIKIVHKVNEGVSSARNIGLGLAKGDWVIFADADDTLPIDSLCYMKKSIFTVEADFYVFNVNCIQGSNVCCLGDPILENIVVTAFAFVKMLLTDNFATGPWAKLFKKDSIGNVKFCKDLKIGEDMLFCIEYCMQIKRPVALIKDFVYNYYIIESSAMNSERSLSDKYQVLSEKLFSLLSGHPFSGYNDEYIREYRLKSLTRGYIIDRKLPSRNITDLLIFDNMTLNIRLHRLQELFIKSLSSGRIYGILFVLYLYVRHLFHNIKTYCNHLLNN